MKSPWIWEHVFEHEPCDPVRGSLIDNLSAHLFHHVTEVHTGWARRLACSAVEATEHVLYKGIRDLRAAFLERPHQVNTSAGRIHFVSKHAIGWTRRETQAAMDAV